jgi:hypothetical protein
MTGNQYGVGSPCAGAVDSVHRAVDSVYTFFFMKIILLFPKIARALEFCKESPELFQNYVLAPVIFYLGPYLCFYNYS